jgi:YegS/Rv2252/BmrU family lipid kinase
MHKKLVFLMNPIAGTRDKSSIREKISARLNQLHIPFEFLPTDLTGSYAALKAMVSTEGLQIIVIVGGDGTVSQVTGALRHLPLHFGVIPTGSGNGLARAANISCEPMEALETIISHGHALPVDAFTINGHYSCMLSGVGFDAQVAHDFSKMKKRGLWTYIKISAGNFFDAVEYPFTLRINGREIGTEAYFISIANANQFGNNFTIAPKANLTDGLLDIIVVQKMNKLQVLMAVFYQMMYGDVQEKIFKKSGIMYYQARALEILNPGLAPLHVDGDPVASSTSLHVKVIPEAFMLIQ